MKNKIQQLYITEHRPVSEICNILRIGRTKFYKLLKKYNIVHRGFKKDIKLDNYLTPTSKLGEQIIQLRKSGKTYLEICKQLKCSKSTVTYYCSSLGKSSRNKIQSQYKKIIEKTYMFCNKQFVSKIKKNVCSKQTLFRTKVSRFVLNWKRYKINKNKYMKSLSYKDVLKYIGGWQTKCYLTGRPIDMLKDDYHFDHIHPISKGGNCELTNLGVTCPEANLSKNNLTLEEYISLCKEVLENFGYTIIK